MLHYCFFFSIYFVLIALAFLKASDTVFLGEHLVYVKHWIVDVCNPYELASKDKGSNDCFVAQFILILSIYHI